MAVVLLRIFAFAVLLLGLGYLYIEFEAVRVGAVSLFSYLGQVVAVLAVVGIAMAFAGKIVKAKAKAREIEGAF